jgi:hypothetical protein
LKIYAVLKIDSSEHFSIYENEDPAYTMKKAGKKAKNKDLSIRRESNSHYGCHPLPHGLAPEK